jgi:hypothetical protein
VGEQLSFLQCVREHLEPGGDWCLTFLIPILFNSRPKSTRKRWKTRQS